MRHDLALLHLLPSLEQTVCQPHRSLPDTSRLVDQCSQGKQYRTILVSVLPLALVESSIFGAYSMPKRLADVDSTFPSSSRGKEAWHGLAGETYPSFIPHYTFQASGNIPCLVDLVFSGEGEGESVNPRGTLVYACEIGFSMLSFSPWDIVGRTFRSPRRQYRSRRARC